MSVATTGLVLLMQISRKLKLAKMQNQIGQTRKLFTYLRLSCIMEKIGRRFLNMLVVDQRKTALLDSSDYLLENSSWDPRSRNCSLRLMMTLLMNLVQRSQNDFVSRHWQMQAIQLWLRYVSLSLPWCHSYKLP